MAFRSLDILKYQKSEHSVESAIAVYLFRFKVNCSLYILKTAYFFTFSWN